MNTKDMLRRCIVRPLKTGSHSVFGVLSTVVLSLRTPWRLFGCCPIDETAGIPIPTKNLIAPMILHAVLLIIGNILFSAVFQGHDIGSWMFFMGVLIALLVSGLNDDFITPWWRRRFLRRINRLTSLVIPDRAIDGVCECEPGEIPLRISNECRLWAKTNLKGKIGLKPITFSQFHKREVDPEIWLKNPDDAFAFKIRWL